MSGGRGRFHTISAETLGFVERFVSSLKQRLGFSAWLAGNNSQAQRDPAVSRHWNFLTIADRVAYALRQFESLHRSTTRSHNEKFFPPVPTCGVIGTYGARDLRRDYTQGTIACGVAIRIVDEFEVVRIGQNHTHRNLAPLGTLQFTQENFQDRGAVP